MSKLQQMYNRTASSKLVKADAYDDLVEQFVGKIPELKNKFADVVNWMEGGERGSITNSAISDFNKLVMIFDELKELSAQIDAAR